MAKSLITKSTIEAMYSAVPKTMSKTQPSCKVFVPKDQPLNNHEVLQKRMQIVIFFKNKSGENSGWHVGGWMKETLGLALDENPIFAGRLRRSEDGSLEIVCNDSGVRCIEAQMPLDLVDFLQSKEKTEVEVDQLVHWIDIDEKTPQFSPLFYVQVTNFQCGGYSIGLSYSLLLADPLLMAKFFTRWANIHQSTAYEKELPKIPPFHAPNMGRNVCYSPVTTLNPNIVSGKTPLTTMFNILIPDTSIVPGDETTRYFALTCIKEAERKLGCEMSSYFTLITKDSSGDTKVEVCSKHHTPHSPKALTYELNHLSWKDLKTNDISFRSKNETVNVLHWVKSDALEGMVLVVNSTLGNHKYGMDVYVTFPNQDLASYAGLDS